MLPVTRHKIKIATVDPAVVLRFIGFFFINQMILLYHLCIYLMSDYVRERAAVILICVLVVSDREIIEIILIITS